MGTANLHASFSFMYDISTHL